jgi:hypothetical protein
LELNAEKTRLIEFGRFAAQTRKKRGAGKPETFDFLGFTQPSTLARTDPPLLVRSDPGCVREVARS